MALLTRNVTATYPLVDGAIPTGTVRFVPNATLASATEDRIISQSPVTATLDATGAISKSLVRTDDPTITPSGWAYTVTERITGSAVRTYLISVPAGAGSLDLADVTPLETAPALVQYALALDLTTEIARAIAAEATKTAKPTYVTLGADVPNATTVQADVTGMGLATGIGSYEFEYVLPYTGSVNSASGITCQLTGPASSYLMYVIEIQNANSSFSSLTKTTLTSPAPASTANVTTAGTLYMCRMRGRIITTAPGTLMPQFAANVGATTTTIKTGAYGRLQAL